jgi:glycerophosphoryl diester phosphodiesterase
MLHRLLKLSAALSALYALVYVAQLPFRAAEMPEAFGMLAHRGVHQTYHRRDLDNHTCTAERIDPPRHGFLENTLPSMQAAFDAGATQVEIDVHSTVDGELVVWHDWTVDCRTEGSGETRTLTLAQLQALDAGYGYTADGGQTFPFRGQGVGQIPSLRQVLRAFPSGEFLINQKDRSGATTQSISATLDAERAAGRACLMARAELNALYLDTPPAQHQRCVMANRQQIKRCLVDYLGTGWLGRLPASCVGQTLTLPDWALMRVLWGWPGTFITRVRASGGKVLIWTNDPARVAPLRALGFDGIFTDRIELMVGASGDHM